MVDAVAALRLDLIGRYLRPHRRTVLLGAFALVIVNLLGVTIPREVRSAVDELQGGFDYRSVLLQAGWIALLASVMAVYGCSPDSWSSASGVRLKSSCGNECLITCSGRSLPGFRAPAAAR